MEVILVVFFTLFAACHSSSRQCCNGDNVFLSENKCLNGNIASVPCNNNSFIIDDTDNETLRIDTLIIADENYCWGRLNGTDHIRYIICGEDMNRLTFDENTIYGILELISVGFLLITIVIYLQIPELLDIQGVCILHAISGLAVSFLVLSINQLTVVSNNDLCLASAYTMYFTMMYTFFWLNLLALHIWRSIVRPQALMQIHCWARIYHIIGVGGSTFLLLVLLVAHSFTESSDVEVRPGLGELGCWFVSKQSQFIYFYTPMAILIAFNVIYYTWTMAVLWRRAKELDEQKSRVLKYRLVLCVKLFVIMGISWVFEIASAAFDSSSRLLEWFWFVTDCANSLQGLFIFIILVVLRNRVIRQMAHRNVCGCRLPNRYRTVIDEESENLDEEVVLS